MSWVAVGAAAVSAGAGIYGAQTAANAQGDAAKKNAELQRQNMLIQLGLAEPGRAMGYGAMSDLANLYGYNLPAYQTANQLMNGGVGSGPISVNGRAARTDYLNPAGAFGLGGNKDQRFGGTIDPLTGTVSLVGDKGKNADKRDALLEEYLRTGVMPKGDHPKIARFIREIDKLRAAGYQYDPNAASAAANYSPVGGQDAQAGNMSRFFTSPDYTFRRDEGQRGIGNSFAARGGAASGNALRALSEFNSNLASGEFGNYTNRLMQMSGFGAVGNQQASNASQNYTQGIAQTNQQQGDARASGVLGTTNSIMGGLGDFAQLWGARRNNASGYNTNGYTPAPGMGIMPWRG